MRRLTTADYRRMPWRNGGGTTTEIAIARLPADPAVAGPEPRFLYRVSIADVAGDGPFSRFDGYDRHIMLLEGAGMTLDCGAHGRIDLTRRFDPQTFSGDWDAAGTLVAGAVRDFNVMVDRAAASSSLDVRRVARRETVACAAGNSCVIYILEGSLEGAAEGETLIVEADAEIAPLTKNARVAIARINLRTARTP